MSVIVSMYACIAIPLVGVILSLIYHTSRNIPQPKTATIPTPGHRVSSKFIVHLVCHAQVSTQLTRSFYYLYSQITQDDGTIPDPGLSEASQQRCKWLRRRYCNHAIKLTHVISSPLSRALDTALAIIKPTEPIDRDKSLASDTPNNWLTILAMPHLQSSGAGPRHIGLDVSALKKKYEGRNIEFGIVKDGWNEKECGKFGAEIGLVKKRVKEVRRWLVNLRNSARHQEQGIRDREILVVSHPDILELLLPGNFAWR